MAEEAGTSQPQPKLDFAVTSPGLIILREVIMNDEPLALVKWQQVKDYLVTNTLTLDEIGKCVDISQCIKKTLDAWVSEQAAKATLRTSLDILQGKFGLNRLAGKVKKRANEIYAAQVQAEVAYPAALSSPLTICFGMSPQPRTQSDLVQWRQGELNELHTRIQTPYTSRGTQGWIPLTNLYGLGGTGKTTLARMYISDWYQKLYPIVIWVHASDVKAIRNTFKNFAYSYMDAFFNLENVSAYQFRRNQSRLIVFDNVEDFQHVKYFWPISGNGTQAPHILVTTRICERFTQSDDYSLRLGVFREKDAVEFIRKRVPGLEESDHPARLFRRLGGLPLAIQQAIAVILFYLISKTPLEAVECYLQKYDQTTEEILTDPRFLKSDLYPRTVFTTFTLAVEGIKKNELVGALAVKLLDYLSYMKSDNVEVPFLHKLARCSEDAIVSRHKYAWTRRYLRLTQAPNSRRRVTANDALELLIKFSLVHKPSPKEPKIEIHRVVQDVVRLTHTPKDRDKILRQMIMELDIATTGQQNTVPPAVRTQASEIAKYATPTLLGQFKGLKKKIEMDSEAVAKIRSRLRDEKDNDIRHLQERVGEQHLALTLLFLESSKMSVSDYLATLGNIEAQTPIESRRLDCLRCWARERWDCVRGKAPTARHIVVTSLVIKCFTCLDTKISSKYFAGLLGADYNTEEIEAILMEMQAENLLIRNCISLDPVVQYAMSFLIPECNRDEVLFRCVEYANNSISDQSASDDLKDEAAQHGFVVLDEYLSNSKMRSTFPTFALEICLHIGKQLLKSRTRTEEVTVGRQFAWVIVDVLEILESHNHNRNFNDVTSMVWKELLKIEEQLWCDPEPPMTEPDTRIGLMGPAMEETRKWKNPKTEPQQPTKFSRVTDYPIIPHRRFFIRASQEITRNLIHVDWIVSQLRFREVFTSNERERCQSCVSRLDKCHEILKTLNFKDPSSARIFIEIVKEDCSGQDTFIANLETILAELEKVDGSAGATGKKEIIQVRDFLRRERIQDDGGYELPLKIKSGFQHKSDRDETIGQVELQELLNDDVEIKEAIEAKKFDGFDKTMCSLAIGYRERGEGSKRRLTMKQFANILTFVKGVMDAYTNFDVDGSGTLDPYEQRDALEAIGSRISYRTYLKLQEIVGDLFDCGAGDGKMQEMNLKSFIICSLLLVRLRQFLDRKNDMKGIQENFSTKDWLKRQYEAATMDEAKFKDQGSKIKRVFKTFRPMQLTEENSE